jgi:catechol 2,3-dioxygenase-like lactoylglutathione lyase family enzyme
MNHLTDIRTIAIPVADQDRALDFYVGQLGFEKLMDAPVEQLGGRWIVVAPPGASTTIALTPASDTTPAGIDTGIRFATANAAAAHEALTSAGVSTDELLTWPGIPPMFTFRDPDGNQLYLVEE